MLPDRRGAFGAVAALVVGLAVVVAGCGRESTSAGRASSDGPVVVQTDPFTHDAAGLAPGQIELISLSSRPDLVSGDAVRIAVRGLAPKDPLSIRVDGRPSDAPIVATASGPGQAAGSRESVLRGLKPGRHTVVAVSRHRRVTLIVTAHDPQQSVLTGTQQAPFVCGAVASGLPAPTGSDCVVPTEIHWWYRNTSGRFQQLSDPSAVYPSDVATTTAGGQQVPYVIRVENVVLNRSITRIAVLDDPHRRGPAPFAAAEWNHDLLYRFGVSCGTGFSQGSQAESDVFGSPQQLGEGWMVAQSTLTIFGVACNQELSAETVVDIEQHVWTEYGDLDHVVGDGASGGAIQQLTIANQYPGLLDALTPSLEFPDVDSTLMTVHDCVLFDRVFRADPDRWTAAKIVAVTGLPSTTACADWASQIGPVFSPASCPAGVANPWSTSNPGGVRCSLADDLRTVLGVDPATGQPLRPLSNVGVEYGLRAYQAGAISADDFVALNQQMGGLDTDGAHSDARTTMSSAAATRAYSSGQIDGRGALDDVPIIDQIPTDTQLTPGLDIHDADRPYQTRARLDAADGGHGNDAIWDLSAPPPAAPVAAEWLDDLDQLTAANPTTSRAQLIAAARPASAADMCGSGTIGSDGRCTGATVLTSPRQVAGGPATEDDIDCQLHALAATPGLTAAQQDALAAVFPDGVCDYTVPSIGDTGGASPTWLTYGSGSTLADPVPVAYPMARS